MILVLNFSSVREEERRELNLSFLYLLYFRSDKYWSMSGEKIKERGLTGVFLAFSLFFEVMVLGFLIIEVSLSLFFFKSRCMERKRKERKELL